MSFFLSVLLFFLIPFFFASVLKVFKLALQESQTAEKWRVENSWGEDRGEKGYLIMTSEWFREFVFEIVVDKKFVPEEVLSVFSQEPIVLPAWDPMGALARKEPVLLQL